MEEFLNSHLFEKMAMEYNKKYGGVSVLQTSCINEEKFRDIAQDIQKLLLMLDVVAKSHPHFSSYREKKGDLLCIIEEFCKELSISTNKDQKVSIEVTNKVCMELLFSVVKRLFALHNERNYDKIEKILTALFDAVNAFYAVF